MNYLDIYTNTFAINSYSNEHHIQYDWVILNMKKKFEYEDTFNVIDIGSGRGQIIKLIKDHFPNSKITSVDLKKYHTYDVHQFISCDLSSYTDRNNVNGVYDILICTDVFEHLDKSFIKDVIEMCSKLSKNCLFGIANHSDIWNDVELHTIQEEHEWWDNIINLFFVIKEYKSHFNNRLYLYEVLKIQ